MQAIKNNLASSKFLQIFAFVIALAIFIPLLHNAKAFLQNKESETASRVKSHLLAMSESLSIADKTGDTAMAMQVLESTTKVINEFVNLPEDSQKRVMNSDLRYCHVASINLSEAASQIAQGYHWAEKDRFDRAIEMCH